MGKYVVERHFDDDQKNVILAPLINCHNPGGNCFKGTKYTVVLSIMLNSFPSLSLSISFMKAKSR